MGIRKCSDEEFIATFRRCGATEAARILQINVRGVFERRRNIETSLGIKIEGPNDLQGQPRCAKEHPGRIQVNVENGIVMVGSDAHYWPGVASTAHRAFVAGTKWFSKDLRAVIMNGDAFDGAAISRHPKSSYSDAPSVKQEIEICQERMGEIAEASGKVEKIWCLG